MKQQSVDIDGEDPVYKMACTIVQRTGVTGIGNLQRTLLIGYNRAARLIERMERDGIVSAADYAGRRALINGAT